MVIWFQGCRLNCVNCFNPETHVFAKNLYWEIGELLSVVLSISGQIEGITISGGEPFEQKDALLAILREIKVKTNLSTIVYTGYEMEELQRFPEINQIFALLDVLIPGRYIDALNMNSKNADNSKKQFCMAGSSNQQIHFLSDRYCLDDFIVAHRPDTEVIIRQNGDVILTGTGKILT